MRQVMLPAIAVLALAAAPLAGQSADNRAGNEITLTGRVIDVNCHTLGVTGASHKQCAQACAKAGVALAILSSDGTIYLPISTKPGDPQNSRLMDFAEMKVKVTGTHRYVNGLHTIEIKSVSPAT